MMTKAEPVKGCSGRNARMAWWHDAKFGMFVHWGCYSVLGRGEQILLRDFMPLDEYKGLADQFQPAMDWADRIADQAVRAGAKYVVLTTRHHDGYCLFKTRWRGGRKELFVRPPSGRTGESKKELPLPER